MPSIAETGFKLPVGEAAEQIELPGDQMLTSCPPSGCSLSSLGAHSSGQMHQSMSELPPIKKRQTNEEVRHKDSNYKYISQSHVTMQTALKQ
jgi:hypothetical protein